jgi:predicted transcriptional regulator
MQGQDVALLLKLAIQNEPQVPSKNLAESLFISPSEVSKSLKRSADSGLLHIANGEKRVNRSALMEFLSHGFKYVFRLQGVLWFAVSLPPPLRNR